MTERGRKKKKLWSVALLALVAVLLAGLVCVVWWRQHARRAWRSELRTAVARRQFARAEALAQNLYAAGERGFDVARLAADAAVKDGRLTDAIRWLDLVPRDSPDWIEAQAQAGEVLLLSQHRLSPAEARLRAVLRVDPDHILARQQLAGLLGMTGRTAAAGEQRVELIRRRRFTRLDLILMGLRETALENADWLKDFSRDAPGDPLTHLAQGYHDYRNHLFAAAETHLRQALREGPGAIYSQALLGRLLVEMRRFSELPAWRAALPPGALDDAEIWATLGEWLQETGHVPEAIRCHLEAVRRDSLQQRSCYQVAQMLQTLQREDEAAPFLRRATQLQNLLLAVKHFHANQDHATIPRIVEQAEQLGLLWEAWGWTLAAGESKPPPRWTAAAMKRLEPRLSPDLPRTLLDANPAVGFDLSRYPLPDWTKLGRSNSSPATSGAEPVSTIAFRDDAESSGLTFNYFNGHDPAFGGRRVFEFAGGGVGVLDYDVDGWPDLHWTQGCRWPPVSGQRDHLDRVFRNRGDGTVTDVTEAARLFEDRYSQGVSIGDWNDDGFPDVFVANVGENRLFRNQGDGTFVDVTEETGIAGNSWTTSCLIADVNGDGWPDLYAVNYLAGRNLLEGKCFGTDGRQRTCTPHDLDAAPDEFYLNLGDGRFAERSTASGLVARTGKGLGIVAADFDGTGKLSLFVANDTDGNLYFQNVGSQGECRFQERAVQKGLAYDHEGRSLASMGVAAGDPNGDGLLDLLVTTYYEESNAFFVQQPGGFFQDQAREFGLRAPSLKLLGFGTQFVDADLDGRHDLVVVNGHVDDERNRNIPYRMRPQFFRNFDGQQFHELAAESTGPWFLRETLGRGLARIDWNRDGREDFAVSHLEHPAVLLTNVTPEPGNTIAVRLHGTIGNRDAVGATVRLEGGNRLQVQQLTAGDGYQASNERVLIFGLGELTEMDRLTVQWPSGTLQVLERPQAGKEYRMIEGRSLPFSSPLSGW